MGVLGCFELRQTILMLAGRYTAILLFRQLTAGMALSVRKDKGALHTYSKSQHYT